MVCKKRDTFSSLQKVRDVELPLYQGIYRNGACIQLFSTFSFTKKHAQPGPSSTTRVTPSSEKTSLKFFNPGIELPFQTFILFSNRITKNPIPLPTLYFSTPMTKIVGKSPAWVIGHFCHSILPHMRQNLCGLVMRMLIRKEGILELH